MSYMIAKGNIKIVEPNREIGHFAADTCELYLPFGNLFAIKIVSTQVSFRIFTP